VRKRRLRVGGHEELSGDPRADDQLAATQVEGAVEFVEWLPDDDEIEPMYQKQVDADLVLTNKDAADVAAAIDQMPESRSDDTHLTEPYEEFIAPSGRAVGPSMAVGCDRRRTRTGILRVG